MPLNPKSTVLVFNYLKNHILKSSFKAFLFAYLYVTLPRIIKIYSKPKKERIEELKKVLKNATHPLKFPMFSARLIAGINLLEPIFYKLLKIVTKWNNINVLRFSAVFLASLITASANFPGFQHHINDYNRFYSLDLTLLLVTRALDTTFSSLFSNQFPRYITKNGDALLFIASSSVIMFSWFYNPHKLPKAYRNWITSAADMDDELVLALRMLHQETLKYGEHGPNENVLKPLCERYNISQDLGNPALTCPIPCQIVHANSTSNCELHVLWRLFRGFKFSMSLYGPLNILTLLIPSKQRLNVRLIKAIRSSIRSSLFLGTFIALNWYSVCLTRRRIGPLLFPNVPVSRFDKTAAPMVGCVVSGVSSLIETSSRRKELALFVAPRALGALLPSEPSKLNLRIESLAFGLSFAILVAYSKESPNKIRGIFGKGLKQVFDVE